MKQPLAVTGVALVVGIVRFVAAAGELPALPQVHAEAELGCLGGVDVEEGDVVADDLQRLAVADPHEMQSVVDEAGLLGWQQFFAMSRRRSSASACE